MVKWKHGVPGSICLASLYEPTVRNQIIPLLLPLLLLPFTLPPSLLKQQQQQGLYLRFWYQVLTCVSVRLREAASSMRSWTLRYFCRSKLRSSCASWWSVKAVRAFLGFFSRTWGLSLLLEISLSPSSFTGGQKEEDRKPEGVNTEPRPLTYCGICASIFVWTQQRDTEREINVEKHHIQQLSVETKIKRNEKCYILWPYIEIWNEL